MLKLALIVLAFICVISGKPSDFQLLNYDQFFAIKSMRQCKNDLWKCDNGKLINCQNLCDGVVNCDDQSDESSLCKNRIENDCKNGSEENNVDCLEGLSNKLKREIAENDKEKNQYLTVSVLQQLFTEAFKTRNKKAKEHVQFISLLDDSIIERFVKTSNSTSTTANV